MRLREAAHVALAEVLADEHAADAGVGLFGDDDAARRREALQPRREIGRRADDRVYVLLTAREQVADDYPPGRYADVDIQRRARRRLQHADAAHDLQRRAHRALRVVLGSDRIAEIGKDAVADKPPHHAAEAVDRDARKLPVAADHFQQIFGLQSLAEARGVHQIDEHDRQGPPLGTRRLEHRALPVVGRRSAA